MKKFAEWLVVLAFVVLIAGCGGGGGGGGGTGTGSTTYTGQQITAFNGTGSNQMFDTRSVLVGNVLQLEITAWSAQGNLVGFTTSGWTTNAPATVATVTSAGVLTAVGASTTTYQIQVKYGGVLYSANLVVSAAQDIVTGLVRNTSNPIDDVIVSFYNSSGTQVGMAYTAPDGTFRASVPSSAATFTIDLSLADPGAVYYYTQFAYGTTQFLEGTSCLAPLPSQLSATATNALPNPIVPDLKSIGPPPPPTGCLE